MRVSGRVEVNLRTKEVAAAGKGFAAEFADKLAELAAANAKRNVTPGEGPGPHPHRPQSPHEDTGDLAASVAVAHQSRGFLETALVVTDLAYGAHLEFGWTNPYSGNHWRYPWLMPALQEAQEQQASIARSTARRWISEQNAQYRGRVNVKAPLVATWLPE